MRIHLMADSHAIGHVFLASNINTECRSMMGVCLYLWWVRDYLRLCQWFASCTTLHIWVYSCMHNIIGCDVDYTQRNVSFTLMECNTISGSGVVVRTFRQNTWTHNAEDTIERDLYNVCAWFLIRKGMLSIFPHRFTLHIMFTFLNIGINGSS